MTKEHVILFALRLVLSGAAGTFAVIWWSRTKDVACSFLVAGFLFRYVALGLELFTELGLIPSFVLDFSLFSILTVLFTALPDILFCAGLLIFILRKNH